jgi:poly(A) polymerase
MPPPQIIADWLSRPATQAVFEALGARGHQVRVVGGAVRNALLGRDVADIDMATTATPDQAMAAAAHAGLHVIPTGLAHGTVTILSHDIPFEVTTLRRDTETDGRHATVAFTNDWAADASRRDFTINALYCNADGTLFDPLAGYQDLLARRVRFIGGAAARIEEDYLRILRFFRFTSEYGEGAADADGLAACNRLHAGLQRLSAERIRTELFKLLTSRRAGNITTLMHRHGYWPNLLGLAPRPDHVQRLINLAPQSDAIVRLFALAVTTPRDCARLMTRLKMSSNEFERLNNFATLVPGFTRNLSDDTVKLWIYRGGAVDVGQAFDIARAQQRDIGGGAREAALQALLRIWQPAPFPLRGRDLVDLGLQPGPQLGIVLRSLEDLWIESGFTMTREALLAHAKAAAVKPSMGGEDTSA